MKGGKCIRKIIINLSNQLYQQILHKVHNSNAISDYLIKLVENDINGASNIERNRFAGTKINGTNIIHNNDTVVLGGSNYVYKLINDNHIKANAQYKVINFINGILIIKKID